MKKMLAALAAALMTFAPAAANAAKFVYSFEFEQQDPFSGELSGDRYKVSGILDAEVETDYGIAQDLVVTGATGEFTSNFGLSSAVTGAEGTFFYFSAFDLVAGGEFVFTLDNGMEYRFDGSIFDGSGSYGEVAGPQTEFTLTAGVPEPATWALMIAGFGLTGAALRRRRARVLALA